MSQCLDNQECPDIAVTVLPDEQGVQLDIGSQSIHIPHNSLALVISCLTGGKKGLPNV